MRSAFEPPLSRQPERFGLDVPPPEDEPDSEVVTPGVLTAGERLVTSMFADVRWLHTDRSGKRAGRPADRMTTLHRWAAAEVGKRQGIVDKFAETP